LLKINSYEENKSIRLLMDFIPSLKKELLKKEKDILC